MDVMKTASDWVKAEVFSSAFFVLFGIVFILACIGFWQWGKTDISKAYIIPTLVAGILLLTLGFGLIFSNQSRITNFPIEYENDASAFVESEIAYVDKVMNDYKIVVFKIIPLIIIVCAILIMFFNTPAWRASLITLIAMVVVVFLIDSNANARLKVYKEQLMLSKL